MYLVYASEIIRLCRITVPIARLLLFILEDDGITAVCYIGVVNSKIAQISTVNKYYCAFLELLISWVNGYIVNHKIKKCEYGATRNAIFSDETIIQVFLITKT